MSYIIRLDDACPNMDYENWNKIILLLNKYNIKSLIAAIPDNLDPSFQSSTIENYDKILIDWSLKHEIALHGYNHLYNSCSKPIYGVKKFSEFAGKDYTTQRNLISNGLKIFAKLKIYPKFFVAPGHSFDITTLDVIRRDFPEMVVSDGLFTKPVIYNGVKFLPQQIANCSNIPFFTVTFCYHPNTMKKKDFIIFENFLKKNRSKFIDIDDIKFQECSFFNLILDKTFNLIKKNIFYVRNISFKL